MALTTSIISHTEKRSVLLLGFCYSLFIAASSQIEIPLLPVPVTMQTLAILFVSMISGQRVAVAAVLVYLTEGAIGLPVFAGFSAGLGHLLSPTGGYLIGFLPMSFVAGSLAEKGMCHSYLSTFLSGFLAVAIAMLSGVMFLSMFVGWSSVFALGVEPFILGELLKLIFIASVIPKLGNN